MLLVFHRVQCWRLTVYPEVFESWENLFYIIVESFCEVLTEFAEALELWIEVNASALSDLVLK